MRIITRGLPAVALLLVLSACGSGSAVSDAVKSAQAGQSAESAAPEATAAPAAAGPDGCSLLSADEVTTLIGANDGGKPSGIDPAGSGCAWTNTDNYYSVTVEYRSSGTAPGGKIPPWDPAFGEERKVGADMRDINGGIEFAIDDRDAMVQVSTTDFAADRASALDLIPKLRQRVG
jgi:hypothetical protein